MKYKYKYILVNMLLGQQHPYYFRLGLSIEKKNHFEIYFKSFFFFFLTQIRLNRQQMET